MISLFTFVRGVLRSRGTWGRVVDRPVTLDDQPEKNPDTIDTDSQGDRLDQVARNPFNKAGAHFRDIGRLFVSAAGIPPSKTGSYAPPQLVFPPNVTGDEEILTTLAYQYDSGFFGGFGPILTKIQRTAMQRGRAICEIDWYRQERGEYQGKIFAHTIFDRDPEEYLLDPPGMTPGVYKKRSAFSSVQGEDIDRMPPGRFFAVTYDPLFDNPYGTAIPSILTTMTETWDRVYDAWRMGLVHAGFGAWIGKYGPELKGNTTKAKAGKAEFIKYLKKIANGTASVFDKDTEIEAVKLQLEAEAFLAFHNSFVEAVSVLWTGSATALGEGKYGTYAGKESIDVRQKSEKEQEDAMFMGLAFTFNFNRRFVNFNFPDVEVYPILQLIQPELIMPTTPETQKTQMSVVGQDQSGRPFVNQYSAPEGTEEGPTS
jgi:hypothetical protein